MLNTLRKKYMAAGIALIIFFLAVLLLSSAVLQRRMVEDWNRSRMGALSRSAAGILEKYDLEEATPRLDTLAFENNVSISVADEECRLLSSTRLRETSRGTVRSKVRKLIRENKEKLKEEGALFYSALNDERMTSFIQIRRVEGVGYVILRKSIRGFNSSMYVMRRCFILASGITMALGIFVMLFLSARMAKPITEINRVTRKIASLDFEERVRVSSRDELGQLGESVNIMSQKLEEALTGLRRDVENRKILVRNMSHELKTPTAVIMGYAENMPYIAENNPQKLEKYCQVIIKECERMDALITQMLEVSAREMAERLVNASEFSASDFLDSIRAGYEDEFPGHKGSLEICQEGVQTIRGDQELLKRAVYNLVKNAVRYGAERGRIQIRLWQQAEGIFFCVENQGSQIPAEEQEKIWDVFYKIDAARKRDENSFGVGLSIVKQTAEAHGGKVFVRNREDGVEVGFFIASSWAGGEEGSAPGPSEGKKEKK